MVYFWLCLSFTICNAFSHADSFVQSTLFAVVMDVRSIITTKIQGIENYQLRRSPFWLSRSLVEWQQELITQINLLKSRNTDETPALLNQRLKIFTTAIEALIDSLEQLNTHSIEPGIVQALARTILQMCNDLITQIYASTTNSAQNTYSFDTSIPDYLYQHPEVDELFTKRLKGVNKAG